MVSNVPHRLPCIDQEGAGSEHRQKRHQGPGGIHRRAVPGRFVRNEVSPLRRSLATNAKRCFRAVGVMHTASLAVCTNGRGLAIARGLSARRAVKQVDRMLSNPASMLTRSRHFGLGAIRDRRPHLAAGGHGLDRL